MSLELDLSLFQLQLAFGNVVKILEQVHMDIEVGVAIQDPLSRVGVRGEPESQDCRSEQYHECW